MSNIKVKIRGVRGSFPVSDRNFLKYGGNTSCIEVQIGNNIIILDAGTGIVKSGDELVQKYITSAINPENRTDINSTILISHIHQDHLLGLTFFKPIHIKNSEITICGEGNKDQSLKENLSNLVFGKTFPLDLGSLACKLNIEDLPNKGSIVINKNGEKIISAVSPEENSENIVITFYKSYVHPQDGVMIYKISYNGKSLVYATDKECYFGGDKKFIKFAKNCDLLVHDSQYTTEDYLNPNSPKQGFGHSTFDMAIEIMKQTNAKQLLFFHYDPSYNDEKLDRIKELYCSQYKNVQMTYEGLEIDL